MKLERLGPGEHPSCQEANKRAAMIEANERRSGEALALAWVSIVAWAALAILSVSVWGWS